MNETPWIDEKYALMLDHYVDKFRVVTRSPLLINFRCPICGDSQKNKHKARAYLYRNKDGGSTFKCHNCGDGRSLKNLLREVSPGLHSDYVLEKYKRPEEVDPKRDRERRAEPIAKRRVNPPGLVRVADLPADHPAVKYWRSRSIPASAMHRVHWCDAYYGWVNEHVIPDKFKRHALDNDCGRIVFSMRNRAGEITGYTGRSINGEEPKYVAVRSLDAPDSAFGLDAVDTSRPVLVVEGPIDSLFLDNCVAMCTSSRRVEVPRRVIVGDNEPRSPEIVNILERNIDAGETVVVWPPDMYHKDINDMVLAGLDPAKIIAERTFRGITARMALAEWRKTSPSTHR